MAELHTEQQDEEGEDENEITTTSRPTEETVPDSSADDQCKNMQLINGVWVYTDQRTGVHYRHDGTDWVAYAGPSTSAGSSAEQGSDDNRPELADTCEKDMQLVEGRWVHTDSTTGLRRFFDSEKREWISCSNSSLPTPAPTGEETQLAKNNASAGDGDNDELEYQLQQERLEKERLAHANASVAKRYTDPKDGTQYEWDASKKAWFPVIDEDFLARYQASYGINTCADDQPSSSSSTVKQASPPPPEKTEAELEREKMATMTADERKQYIRERKRERKRLEIEAEKKRGWIELNDTNNCNVYVSGLPSDITEKEFEEIMSKAGIIQKDPRTAKLKMKLYADEQGNYKGDGRCCYIKHESVDLALQVLDGACVRAGTGQRICVEPAQFEQKGAYDPAKKKKKLTAQQKKRLIESKERMLDWKPEKSRFVRPKSDCTVVIYGMFTMEELKKNPARLLELKDQLAEECSRFGTVRKVHVYENNPDGVATVTFEAPEMSDECVQLTNYRVLHGRQLKAELWDGHTKYKVRETEEMEHERLGSWEHYLEGEDSTTSSSSSSKVKNNGENPSGQPDQPIVGEDQSSEMQAPGRENDGAPSMISTIKPESTKEVP